MEDADLSDNGNTHPLHVAASQNILKLGNTILSGFSATGVDPSVRDGFGRTPLHWAAMADRTNFVLLLLEKGATVDAVDCQNRTPLMSGSAFGATGAVRLLLQWGADVSKASRGGLTPLHAAAAGGQVETAEVLIAAGADVHKRTDMGANPRHCAEKQGHADVVVLLSSRGSRSSSVDEDGGVAAPAGGHGFWGRSGGGRGKHAYTKEQHLAFAQHRFSRQSLLRRPLFQ